MSRYIKAEVADNQRLHPEYNLLTLSPLSPSEEPEPGQFYMVGLPLDPLLKRPFSHFRRLRNGEIQIFFRIVGKGTSLLSELKRGSVIELLGPLGRSYPQPSGDALIVAGGLGIASLYPLIERLNKAFVFYGAKNSGELFFLEEIKRHSTEVFVTTDDGSAGERGLITERLNRFLDTSRASFTIYACGPRKMLENVSEMAKKRGFPAYVSVEERMACGIGACLGCVVRTKAGYQRVCKEGPVFRSEEIIW